MYNNSYLAYYIIHGLFVCTLKIWPSGYLSRIAFIVTDNGGRLGPNCSPVKGSLIVAYSS